MILKFSFLTLLVAASACDPSALSQISSQGGFASGEALSVNQDQDADVSTDQNSDDFSSDAIPSSSISDQINNDADVPSADSPNGFSNEMQQGDKIQDPNQTNFDNSGPVALPVTPPKEGEDCFDDQEGSYVAISNTSSGRHKLSKPGFLSNQDLQMRKISVDVLVCEIDSKDKLKWQPLADVADRGFYAARIKVIGNKSNVLEVNDFDIEKHLELDVDLEQLSASHLEFEVIDTEQGLPVKRAF